MKKGFTLIELLIVMVLVGVLVTVALPKYYVSMERGRAMEGINNLRAASDYMNARYVMDGNQYKDFTDYRDSDGNLMGDFTKSVYFTAPQYSASSTSAGNKTVYIKTDRINGSYEYAFSATNQDGELKQISCYSLKSAQSEDVRKLCENIGFDCTTSSCVMDFTK